MGGDLQVESHLGDGSSFKVSLLLPWVENNKVNEPKLKKIIGYEGLQQTICIVDDDPVLRGLLAELLVPLGFNTVEAHDAENCLKLIEQVHPDLFLMDISMPGMSGLELVHKLRQEGSTTPVVMLSADAKEYNNQEDYQTDYDDYLVKPVSNHQLLEKVAQCLDLDWIYRGDTDKPVGNSTSKFHSQLNSSMSCLDHKPASLEIVLPQHSLLLELKAYAEMGYQKGVNASLQQISDEGILDDDSYGCLVQLSDAFQFEQLAQHIEAHSA